MLYKITDINTGKIITEYEMALKMYKNGQHIIYCDIEGIAEIDGNFFLLDECGNYACINTDEFKIERS